MISKRNALSNFDIMKIIESQGVDDFVMVCMKDELPENLKRGSYIVNLASSKDSNGTHWCAFYKTDNFSYYFDSYGFIAPLEVQNKIKPYMYNDNEIQDIDSTACGYYCSAFVLFMHKKITLKWHSIHL